MPVEPADRPVLDPDDIAGHAFTKARKGYEVDEVRAFLVALGSRVRASGQQFANMERRVAELERRAVDPKDLDEDAVTQLLGEETVRVLDTARKAATEIRTKAEEKASTTIDTADAQATETRRAADAYAAGVRAGADERATSLQTEADAYAAKVRRAADADTTSQRTEADAYAAEVRATADAEVGAFRATATAEIERIRSEADTVLADRTADAEVAAGGIRVDADAYHGRVHDEADRYAEATRAAADSYRIDVQGGADAYREAATADGDRLRTEALADAEAIRQAAETDAVARREATGVEVEAHLAGVRDQGRAMVQEARTYRERIIADLADRRRAARALLEQMASTRDALAVTLTDVGSRIEASHRSLQDAVIEPRESGDLAQDRRILEASDQPGTSVGVGEIESLAEPPRDGDPDPEPAAVPGGGAEASKGDAANGDDPDRGDGADPAARPVSDASVDTDAVPDEPADATPTPEPGDDPVTAPIGHEYAPDRAGVGEGDDPIPGDPALPDEVGTEAGTEASDEAASDEAVSVDDIFARLRAEQEESTPEEQAAPDPEASQIAEEAAEAPVDVADDVDVDSGAGGDGDGDGQEGAVETVVKDVDPDTDLLDSRDATTDDLERQLARRLKRVLSDEQNEALDLLRRTRGTPGAAEVLPSEADHLERYTAAALEDLTSAERAGAAFFGPAPRRTADVRDVASEFATEMVRQIRGRLERAFHDGGDENEVGERIRACYREWKTQRIADTARHYVVVAFSRGVAEATADSTRSRWLVDDGGAPCPDCDDNALAGPTAKGEPFPTGDLCPPAHPGCRCLAVPLDAD